MIKGIRINGIHSYEDLGLMISKRNISPPTPNKITESVPYQNGEYDFSLLNGEITYQNRTLSYTFDIAELDTAQMEFEKRKILNWLHGVIESKIYDDYIPGYYFFGSLDSYGWSEDFGQGEMTIKFTVYPYLYETQETIKKFEVEEELLTVLKTESSHRIIPTIIVEGEILITRGSENISIAPGTYKDIDFYLEPENDFRFIGTGSITFQYINEVL